MKCTEWLTGMFVTVLIFGWVAYWGFVLYAPDTAKAVVSSFYASMT